MTILGGAKVIFYFAFLFFVLSCQTNEQHANSTAENKTIAVIPNKLPPPFIKEVNQGDFLELFDKTFAEPSETIARRRPQKSQFKDFSL